MLSNYILFLRQNPKANENSAFVPGQKWFPIDDDGIFQLADIDYVTTYKAMEKLLQTGKVRAIGVSNFSIRRLEHLLKQTEVVPAVNQVEAHPYLTQPDLLQYCQGKDIFIQEMRRMLAMNKLAPLEFIEIARHIIWIDFLMSPFSEDLEVELNPFTSPEGIY